MIGFFLKYGGMNLLQRVLLACSVVCQGRSVAPNLSIPFYLQLSSSFLGMTIRPEVHPTFLFFFVLQVYFPPVPSITSLISLVFSIYAQSSSFSCSLLSLLLLSLLQQLITPLHLPFCLASFAKFTFENLPISLHLPSMFLLHTGPNSRPQPLLFSSLHLSSSSLSAALSCC